MELTPALPHGEVLGRLKKALAQSKALRGAVAYWTLDPKLLAPELGRCLGSGFLCVDIHYPTSIDYLAALTQAGANVFLHLYDLAGQSETPGIVGLPPHLMHAKMLLFDLQGDDGQVWIGSHNWSQRSLYGVNAEASLVASTKRADTLYAQVVQYLDGVRARCVPFDLASVDYYKWLQGEEPSVNVIELEDRTGGLAVGDKFTILGTQVQDHQQLTRVGNEVVVSVTAWRTPSGGPDRPA